MADGKVKFTYFGDGKDLEKELVRLEKKHDDLSNKIGQVSRRSRKSSKTGVQGLVDQIKGAANLTAAFEGVKAVISAITAEQRKLSQSIDQTIPKLDEQQLKLQIQAGLTPRQVEGKIPQIRDALLNTPSADLGGAFMLQTQLVSSGFNQQDIDSGAALQTVLDLKAATNQFGEGVGDVKESVAAVAQFLKATGSETTARNIRKIGGNLTQLFEGSDIQFADLGPLAGEASTLTSKGLSTDIQLAAFSALRDVKAAPEAATGFRQVVSRMSSAGESPAKVQALESIGLKPEDIDMIGEDFTTALKRLKGAVDAVDEKTGRSAVFALFGEKGESAGNALLGKLDVIEKRLSILRGGAFERNVKIFQESRTAERQRVGIRREFAERDLNEQRGGMTFQDARDLMQARFAEDMANQNAVLDRIGTNFESVIDAQGLAVGEGFGMSAQESYRATQAAREGTTFFNPTNILGGIVDRFSQGAADYVMGNNVFQYAGRELDVPQPGRGGRQPADGAAPAGGMRVAVDNSNVERKLDEQRAVGDRTNSLLEEQNNLLRQPGAAPRRPVNRNAQGE